MEPNNKPFDTEKNESAPQQFVRRPLLGRCVTAFGLLLRAAALALNYFYYDKFDYMTGLASFHSILTAVSIASIAGGLAVFAYEYRRYIPRVIFSVLTALICLAGVINTESTVIQTALLVGFFIGYALILFTGRKLLSDIAAGIIIILTGVILLIAFEAVTGIGEKGIAVMFEGMYFLMAAALFI